MKTLGTIAARLNACRGVGPGFDALRLLLASAVVLLHSAPLAVGAAGFDYRGSWLHAPILAIVPLFFGLSGFLVSGSALRARSPWHFAVRRGLRIVPALTVEVVLSAIVLGGLVTTLPLADYFRHPDFWRYFGNIVGLVRFELPGVFEHNAYPRTVNGNMWTLPPEYLAYGVVFLSVWLLGTAHLRLRIGLLVLTLLGFVGADAYWHIGLPDYSYSGAGLVLAFLTGSLYFHIQHRLPHSPWLCLLAVVLYLVSARTPGLSFLALVFLVYVVVYLGCLPIRLPRLLAQGDYSYGIYLYGFPIQQWLSTLGAPMHPWYGLFLASMLLTTLVSVVSWHVIEKPTLALKRYF